MVAGEFPDVRFERSNASRGYIVQRNRGAQLATGPIIVSADDDAEFLHPGTVAQTIADFDDPRVGVVAIPFVDVRRSPDVRQRAPSPTTTIWAASTYWGTAHALRRDLFLALGGYRAVLEHQCEEMDYSLRLLEAGYVTRLGRAEPLVHYEAPSRDRSRISYYDRRNNVLHGWHNAPLPYLPVRLAKVTAHTALLAVQNGNGRALGRGLIAGFAAVMRGTSPRSPVSRSTYRADHMLRKHGPLVLEAITPLLRTPPLDPARSGGPHAPYTARPPDGRSRS